MLLNLITKLSASSLIPNNENDARGYWPCLNLKASTDQLDINPDSVYINENVQGQWDIGMSSPYSNWILG